LSSKAQVHRCALAQERGGTGDRPPGIDNVVNEQRPPPGNVGRNVGEKMHVTAALLGEAVAAQPYELNLGAGPSPVEGAGKVGDKHRCTLEQLNHDEIARNRPRDLAGKRFDPCSYYRFAKRIRMLPICASRSVTKLPGYRQRLSSVTIYRVWNGTRKAARGDTHDGVHRRVTKGRATSPHRRDPALCQRMTVSGLAIVKVFRTLGVIWCRSLASTNRLTNRSAIGEVSSLN
jgi:hypothetical protein